MTPDEFLALPPILALRVLLEAAPGLVGKLREIPVPKTPQPPRYDLPIYRKDGIQWASETELSGLLYWRGKYQESVDKGGPYAAKDAKRVKSISAFIEWRQVFPTAQWSGARNDEDITAAPPSSRPRVHSRQQRSEDTSSGDSDGGESFDTSGY